MTRHGLARREKQHRQTADRGDGWRLHAAIRKYGHDNIVFSVLGEFGDDIDLALIYEEEAIAAYKPEYNMSIGGEGMRGPLAPESLASFRAKRAGVPSYRKGVPLTEEHKANIRAANKGQGLGRKGPPLSEAHRARLREANLGNKHMLGVWRSEAWPGNIRAGELRKKYPYLQSPDGPKPAKTKPRKERRAYSAGHPQTEATKQKLREQRLGVKLAWTPARAAALAVSIEKARAARLRPLKCVNDGRVFASSIEAGAFYGLRPELIRQQTHRGQKTRGGLKFEWVPKSQ